MWGILYDVVYNILFCLFFLGLGFVVGRIVRKLDDRNNGE